MKTSTRIKIALWVISLFWIVPVAIFASGGEVSKEAWAMAGFLGLLFCAISYPVVRQAKIIFWEMDRSTQIAAALSRWALPVVRKIAHVDPKNQTAGVRPVGQAWPVRTCAVPGGAVTEIGVPRDSDVVQWQDCRGNIARILGINLANPEKDLRIAQKRPGLMEWRIIGKDVLMQTFNPWRIPEKAIAISEDGNPISWNRIHTLIGGATGSGKGSVLDAVIYSEIEEMKRGETVFYGIDVKMAEFANMSPIFRETAFEPESGIELLERIVAIMNARRGGRDFTQSEKTPLIILMIDELPSFILGADSSAEKKKLNSLLGQILRQGRSLGVIVVAATQDLTKEVIESRNSFALRILLRVEKKADTDLIFGTGAAEAGATPHEIRPATPGNSYATAGIAYTQDEHGGFTRMRFPYWRDADLEVLRAEVAEAIAGEIGGTTILPGGPSGELPEASAQTTEG